jgi:uncharacterized sulfatase
MATRYLILSLTALVLAGLAYGCTLESTEEFDSGERSAPNVVIVFLDDVGYGDLGSYGHPTIRTPNMDRMAAEGVRLTGFYAAAPSCSPSRAGLLTGRYPVRAGILWALGPEEENGIQAEEWTLAEALREQGYRTAAVGKWHLGSWPGLLPTEHGFDSFFGLLYSNDMIRPWVNTDRPLELYRDTEPIEHPVDQATLTRRYTEESVRFIESAAAGDEPFFLYLAHSMAHVPLYRSPEFEGRSAGGKYGDVDERQRSVGRDARPDVQRGPHSALGRRHGRAAARIEGIDLGRRPASAGDRLVARAPPRGTLFPGARHRNGPVPDGRGPGRQLRCPRPAVRRP